MHFLEVAKKSDENSNRIWLYWDTHASHPSGWEEVDCIPSRQGRTQIWPRNQRTTFHAVPVKKSQQFNSSKVNALPACWTHPSGTHCWQHPGSTWTSVKARTSISLTWGSRSRSSSSRSPLSLRQIRSCSALWEFLLALLRLTSFSPVAGRNVYGDL